MKIPLMTFVLFAGLTSSASALSPAAEAVLKELGVDPASAEARIAEEDGTIATTYRDNPAENSLESLIAKKWHKGALAFIGTRVFIRKLKDNYAGTSVPKANYDALYLTKEERVLAGRKLAEGISTPKKPRR